MSPMKLGTLIASAITTGALVLIYWLEGVAHADLVPEPVTILMSCAVIVSWLSFAKAHCRDTVIKAGEQNTAALQAAIANMTADAVGTVQDTIHKAIEEAGDRRATEARLDTLARVNQEPHPIPRTRMSIVD